jgi:hypothetical protein
MLDYGYEYVMIASKHQKYHQTFRLYSMQPAFQIYHCYHFSRVVIVRGRPGIGVTDDTWRTSYTHHVNISANKKGSVYLLVVPYLVAFSGHDTFHHCKRQEIKLHTLCHPRQQVRVNSFIDVVNAFLCADRSWPIMLLHK